MSLGRLTSPKSPWEGLQVTNFDQCLRLLIVIGKCTDTFKGIFWLGEGGYAGGSFHGGIFHGGENFHEGDAGFLAFF